MSGRIGINELRAALTYIPADDRDLWWRIGMALKSELGDDGLTAFLEWSEKGASFDAKAAKATWKGFKPGGAVTIATLIWEAKERGFDPKQIAPAAPLSVADKARIKKERAAMDKAAADEAAALQARAANEAAKQWRRASTVGTSDYLNQKGVKPYGVRFDAKAILIPLVDDQGKLWNVQRIFDNGDKRFLPGGRVSGCFHVIGSIADSGWLLVAEGYATAARLYQATGYAVVVAFNAANLKHAAACMRAGHPSARMLICADDDRETEIKTGKNPGVAAATAAASSNGARWCKPSELPEGGTDFDDLAQAKGLDVVARQIADAVRDEAAPVAERTLSSMAMSIGGATTGVAAPRASVQLANPNERLASARRRGESSADSQSRKPFFNVNEDGVWFHGYDQRGEPMAALWICSELRITAQSRDAGDGDWGRLLEFSDPDGNPKRWVMPSTMLAGDGTQYRATLLGMGLRIGASVAAKNQLTVYIQTEKTEARVRCTDRIGWHDDVYVMPDRTIGESEEVVMFQAAGGVVSQFKQRGTLTEWRDNVAAHCRGNSRMLFCVSTAFAAPLMHLAKISSGGFHIWGDSSSGKSTAVKVAGSVFGGKNYPRNWHTTGTSLESTASQHSDALLLLDEIAQVDPKVVGDIVYMLANEAGKGRGTQLATARKIATWRLLFLSDGEVSLASHMEQAGKGAKAGHDVRMAHINADAGKGLGVYDTLHGFDNGAELSDHLVKMSHQYYGTAGIALIEHLVADVANISDAMVSEVSGLAREMCPADSHGQVARVAARFALVGLSGEVATSAGITGWEPGEAITAARTCFNNWLEGRGGAGNVEHVSILRQVSAFFQAHGNARFVTWHRSTDDHAPNTINRAGFRRYLTGDGAAINTNADHHRAYGDAVHPEESAKIEQEYFVLSEVFKNEICKGFNHKLVAQLLIKEGLLMPESAADGASATRKERLPGIGLVRCYRFKPGILTVGA